MKKEILVANRKNMYGRFYTLDSLEKIVSDWNTDIENIGHSFGIMRDNPDFVEYGERDSFLLLSEIAFEITKMEIKGQSLFANIKILGTKMGKTLKKNIRDIVFRTTVWGNILDDGEVQVERLVSLNAIFKEDDSFRNPLWEELN